MPRLLMISIDRNIFEEGSAVRARIEQYASLIGGIDIIVAGAQEGEPVPLKNNCVAYRASGRNKISIAYRVIAIAKKLSHRASLITVQDPFELGLLGLWISRAVALPLHVQVHIDFYSPYFRQESLRQFIQACIAPFVLRRAAGVRVVSSKLKDYLTHSLHIAQEKITTVPVYVDPIRVKQAPITVDLHTLFPEHDWIALVACRYVKQKNILLAIDAFAEFRKSYPRSGLVIAGSGPEEKNIRAHIARNNLTDCVHVGSWSTEFASCMKTSDAFILSSDYEGWGMTVIEASILARPVVMTDVGCAREFVIEGETGLVVGVRNRKDLAKALQKLRSDPTYANKLSEQAAKKALALSRADNDALMVRSWSLDKTHTTQ